MPTISTTKTGKNAGKQYLNYTMAELSAKAQKEYEAQEAGYTNAGKLRDAFIATFRAEHKDVPAGAAILCSFGKVAVPKDIRETTAKGAQVNVKEFFPSCP
jgi:hypothetical protein